MKYKSDQNTEGQERVQCEMTLFLAVQSTTNRVQEGCQRVRPVVVISPAQRSARRIQDAYKVMQAARDYDQHEIGDAALRRRNSGTMAQLTLIGTAGILSAPTQSWMTSTPWGPPWPVCEIRAKASPRLIKTTMRIPVPLTFGSAGNPTTFG